MSAETILYGNHQIVGRPFPRAQIVRKLSWLQPYLDRTAANEEANESCYVSDMLNIIFVFMGARTSTLLAPPADLTLLDRLNSVIESLGYPEIKIEDHENGTAGPHCICIYRRDNPRYLRRYNLTDREIGRNLDY